MDTKQKLEVLEMAGYELRGHPGLNPKYPVEYSYFRVNGRTNPTLWQYGSASDNDPEPFDRFINRVYQHYLEGSE